MGNTFWKLHQEDIHSQIYSQHLKWPNRSPSIWKSIEICFRIAAPLQSASPVFPRNVPYTGNMCFHYTKDSNNGSGKEFLRRPCLYSLQEGISSSIVNISWRGDSDIASACRESHKSEIWIQHCNFCLEWNRVEEMWWLNHTCLADGRG